MKQAHTPKPVLWHNWHKKIGSLASLKQRVTNSKIVMSHITHDPMLHLWNTVETGKKNNNKETATVATFEYRNPSTQTWNFP